MTSGAASAPFAQHVGPCGQLHAGTSVGSVMRTLLVAALPCACVGLYATGYQALVGLGADAPGTWRTELLSGCGMPAAPAHVGACLLLGATYLLPVLAVAWGTGEAWERVFAAVRRRPRVAGLLPTALLLTLLLPPATPLVHVVLGMSFAVVLTRELFGGTGMGFVSAPAAGVAFLALAFPKALAQAQAWPGLRGYAGTTAFHDVAGGVLPTDAGITYAAAFFGRVPGMLGTTSVAACALGAAFLVARGVVAWRIPVAALAGVLLGTWLLGAEPAAGLGWTWHVLLGGFAFGAVFLAADPATAPVTHGGRWMTGLLVGFVTVLIRSTHPQHPDGIVFAVLLAGVFAPLFDHGAAWLQLERRRRRHG